MSKQEFKTTLEGLVAKFERNVESYKKAGSSFNETQLRIEFLDPMFEALGWDMNNKAGAAEQYKEVVHEDKVYIKGKPKAPDYSFRFWGERKFFLEAKQPFVKIFSDFKPAFQLRRYAWSAHLPVSILSDFEEFAVYDTTIEPKANDLASSSRLKYYKYTEYLEKWEEIYDTFAKESIQQGSFDKYVAKEKRGNQLVDKVFLKEIESWREWLAKDLAHNNQDLSVEDLNFSVQKIIDRIIFLRIAEDRGIEEYETLQRIVSNENSYTELVKHFKKAEQKYNSGLFDFTADTLTPRLHVSDKMLDKILGHLYYPKSPYEFSVLGVEILGNIYEQFLGKVIRLTASHNAIIEEKPEVKKAGGVYYTPQYIVEYIVKNTVGELVKGKNVREVSKLKILDPACGSGSFLIGAYEYLLNWHLEQYEKLTLDEKERFAKRGVIFKQENKDASGKLSYTWQLTTSEKKRIMRGNIYGVDIDEQAVEVTKLSLALKMLENENQQSISQQFSLFTERLLPDMSENIKCGNSLVGSDYWDDKDLSQVSEEEIRKVNAFDWDKEFSEVFKQGGFDTVIGNPPYVRQESLGEFKEYFAKKYNTYHGMADLYVYFIEKSMRMLHSNGLYGVIVANKWMRAGYGEALREWLKQKDVKQIVDFGDLPVFGKVSAYPCILIASGLQGTLKHETEIATLKTLEFTTLDNAIKEMKSKTNLSKMSKEGWALVSSKEQDLMEKLKRTGIPLKEYVNGKIYRGVLTGLNEAFVIDQETKKRLIKEDPKSAEVIKPLLAGREIKRYSTPAAVKYLIFTRRGINIDAYPSILKYLENFKTKLMPKPKNHNGNWDGRKLGAYEWYEIQDAVDYYEEFEKPKIVWPETSLPPNFAQVGQGIHLNKTTFFIPVSNNTILGLLNSKVIEFFLTQTCGKMRGGYLMLSKIYVEQCPIPVMSESQSAFLEKHVAFMIETKKQYSSIAVTESQKKILQQRAESLDKQIDELVYELYGLTKEEINIIESIGTKTKDE